MKHKQYENWILEETSLTDQQQMDLNNHLSICNRCQVLKNSWTASRKLIVQATIQEPAIGFSDRWQKTLIKKEQIAKIRRHRLSLFGLLILTFFSSIVYLLMSRSFLQLFANGFTMASKFAVSITNGLSSVGIWFNRLPVAVPITAGFVFLGLVTAFFMAALFLLWNLKQRNLQTNEIPMD